MAVIQPALQISDSVLKGLMSGEYTRIGGVVRDQKGRLVELLADASMDKSNRDSLIESAALTSGGHGVVGDIVEAISKNKGIAISAAIGLAAAVTGLIYFGVKSSKKKNELPECIMEYFDAIDKGEVEIETIEKVLDFLNGANGQKFTLTADQFALLTNVVREYTIKLAEANNVDVSEMQNEKCVSIKEFLSFQKKIFDAA